MLWLKKGCFASDNSSGDDDDAVADDLYQFLPKPLEHKFNKLIC
jgi:hypothetical protein